jgi:hypothetical protein
MPTQTQQVREAVTVDGIVKFRIDVTVLDKGDLPSSEIFVLTIVDPLDSKEDTFARVATIPDLDELSADRGTAIDQDDLEFRVSLFTFWYADLDTAVNAQNVLKERIDELVSDYETYEAQFVTVSETTVHPQVGESTYEAAVTAYQDSMRSLLDAEAARDDAETTYNDAVTEANAATIDLDRAKTISQDCATTLGFFDTLKGDFVVLKGDGATFKAAAELEVPTPSSTFASALAAFTTTLRNADTQNTRAAADYGTFSGLCGARSSEYNSAQAAKISADTAVGNARTAFESAQAAVETAQQGVNAALAAVQALKPDFDPTSVLPTPEDS